MWYWIVMGILIFVAVLLIVIIVVALTKGKKTQDSYDYDEDYEDDLEEDDYEYEEEYRQPRRVKEAEQRREIPEQTTPFPASHEQESVVKGPVKKQWKLILENLDTWEKFDFIFYDNIGIGRSRNSSEFERFLSVQDDPRVSKLHCAIIRKEDKLYLKDMGSRNGTYLNGHRIQQPIVIQRDDVIGIGETKIEVRKVLRERD